MIEKCENKKSDGHTDGRTRTYGWSKNNLPPGSAGGIKILRYKYSSNSPGTLFSNRKMFINYDQIAEKIIKRQTFQLSYMYMVDKQA